jgi:hypothetical protein
MQSVSTHEPFKVGQLVQVWTVDPNRTTTRPTERNAWHGIVYSVGERRIVLTHRGKRGVPCRVAFDAATGRAVSKYKSEFIKLDAVPCFVLLRNGARGDGPYWRRYARPGVHQVLFNRNYAVSVLAEDGELLALRPEEFVWCNLDASPRTLPLDRKAAAAWAEVYASRNAHVGQRLGESHEHALSGE